MVANIVFCVIGLLVGLAVMFFIQKSILKSKAETILKEAKAKRFSSMIAYKLLFNSVKQKFILNSNVYLVNSNNAKKYIITFIDNIEGDIDYIEKNFS